MRYLREWTNPQGKQAQAFEDEVTEIDVGPRLVTLTSRQGNGQLVVRAQFTRSEFARVIQVMKQSDWLDARLPALAQVRRSSGLAAKVARFLFGV